ncbi:hypothetical protein IC1_05165 [Bacillus cereus VD022]|uniref:Uncharacterized protein n=1 Tax=Bacillus cereus TIAC219 TaxID=718222 RepID=A0ABC9STS7_BACCE|nr:hypothetical protein IC1_05165 [Bacillus cereus VD022]EOQ59320.1 hypothetical protein IAY_05127 [Bacillus cereus TIAC219]
MMSFFTDLIDLTPIQHLIRYWIVWGVFALVCYITLFYNDRVK